MTTMVDTKNTHVLTDIDGDYTFDHAIYVGAIVFIPGGINNKIVIKNNTDAGALIIQMTSGDGEERVFYPPTARMIPMIDYNLCALTAGSTLIFYIR